jgi:hypothetical protein
MRRSPTGGAKPGTAEFYLPNSAVLRSRKAAEFSKTENSALPLRMRCHSVPAGAGTAERRICFCKLVVTVAALFVIGSPAAAAAPRRELYTKWENFTKANGMPDEKVFCVTVDGERVWAGTENGLVLIE